MQSHHYPILYQVEETHWWYVGRRRIIRCLVEKISTALNNTNLRILDVGCGTGANLKMLADYGSVEGVDISPQAVEFCGQRGLDTVKLGAVEHLPYEGDSFELVTALDVVEHLMPIDLIKMQFNNTKCGTERFVEVGDTFDHRTLLDMIAMKETEKILLTVTLFYIS